MQRVVLTSYVLIPTTLCGPAISVAVPWAIPASTASTGLVRLAVGPTLTAWSLVVPVSTRPVTTAGTSGGLYAVSLASAAFPSWLSPRNSFA